MSNNVIIFPGITRHDLPADQILEAAKGQLERVVILGYDKEGLEYVASSCADMAEAVWLMERAKRAMLEAADEED